ncbi:hypothetical protein PFISCL1PPCAC_18389, partial [Pristionchus fissidentatus]
RMRHDIALSVGSRDELPGWFLIDGDTIFVQIGADSTVLCLAQSPTLSSMLVDHASPVALHIKIIAQRLSKCCPGKQIFVATDKVEEESSLFWNAVCGQLRERLAAVMETEREATTTVASN